MDDVDDRHGLPGERKSTLKAHEMSKTKES